MNCWQEIKGDGCPLCTMPVTTCWHTWALGLASCQGATGLRHRDTLPKRQRSTNVCVCVCVCVWEWVSWEGDVPLYTSWRKIEFHHSASLCLFIHRPAYLSLTPPSSYLLQANSRLKQIERESSQKLAKSAQVISSLFCPFPLPSFFFI